MPAISWWKLKTQVRLWLSQSMDFKHNANLATEYLCDKNDNLIKDYNKSISEILYNVLNLLRTFKISSIANTHTYAVDGRKLKTAHAIFTWRIIWVIIVWLIVTVLFRVVIIIRSGCLLLRVSLQASNFTSTTLRDWIRNTQSLWLFGNFLDGSGTRMQLLQINLYSQIGTHPK